MKIGPLENGPIGPRLEDHRRTSGERRIPEEKNDRIEISSEARAKHAASRLDDDSIRFTSVADAPGGDPPSAADSARLELVRQRIESGFYDREDVRLIMAEKLTEELQSE